MLELVGAALLKIAGTTRVVQQHYNHFYLQNDLITKFKTLLSSILTDVSNMTFTVQNLHM